MTRRRTETTSHNPKSPTLAQLVQITRDEFLAQCDFAIKLDPENGKRIWLEALQESLDQDSIRMNGLRKTDRRDLKKAACQIAGRQILKEQSGTSIEGGPDDR